MTATATTVAPPVSNATIGKNIPISEIEFSPSKQFSNLGDVTSGQSANSRRFLASPLSTKFSRVGVVSGQKFTVCVGSANTDHVSKGVFGSVLAFGYSASNPPRRGADSAARDLGGGAWFASLDPTVGPSTGYSVAEIPNTQRTLALAVFGGVTVDENGNRLAADTSFVWVFGIWTTGSQPFPLGTSDSIQAKYTPNKDYVYGWFRFKAVTPSPPPRCLHMGVVLGASSPRLMVFSGLAGAGYTMDEAVKSIRKGSDVYNARLRIADARSKAKGIKDPKVLTAVSFVALAQSMVLVAEFLVQDAIIEPVDRVLRTQQLATAANAARKAYDANPTETDLYDKMHQLEQEISTRTTPTAASKLLEGAKANLAEVLNATTAAYPEYKTLLESTVSLIEDGIMVSAYFRKRVTSIEDPIADMWAFDFSTRKWSSVVPPPNVEPRWSPSVATAHDFESAHMFGGYGKDGEPLRDVWRIGSNGEFTNSFGTTDGSEQASAVKEGYPELSNVRKSAIVALPSGDVLLYGGFETHLKGVDLMKAELTPSDHVDSAPVAPRAVSTSAWVFSDKNRAFAKAPHSAAPEAPLETVRSSAFASAFVSEEPSDANKELTVVNVVGGFNVSEDTAINPQPSLSAAVANREYPAFEFNVRKTGVTPLGVGNLETKPPKARLSTGVTIASAALVVIWIAIIVTCVAFFVQTTQPSYRS